jgi:hypothetical protein
MKKVFLIGLVILASFLCGFAVINDSQTGYVNGSFVTNINNSAVYYELMAIPGTKVLVDYNEAYGNGDDVSPWTDKSGNGTDFTQGTASYKPHWNTTNLVLGSVLFGTGLVLGSADADLHNIPVAGNAWSMAVIAYPISGGGGSTGRIFDKYTKWLCGFTGVTTPVFFMNIGYATKSAAYNCPVTAAYSRAVLIIVTHTSDITVKPRMFVYGLGTANGEVTVTDASGGTPAGAYDDSGGTFWVGNVIARDRSFDGNLGFLSVVSGYQYTEYDRELLKILAKSYGVTIP